MRTIKIDEYLVINVYSGTKRWLVNKPTKSKTNEIFIHVKGIVHYPENMFTVDFSELTVTEQDVMAQARMG